MKKEKTVHKKNALSAYVESAIDEWHKITWPTTQQAGLLTAITVVVSGAVIAFIGGVDLSFNELYQWALDFFS
jgi:preprotein translocase SecE subunit